MRAQVGARVQQLVGTSDVDAASLVALDRWRRIGQTAGELGAVITTGNATHWPLSLPHVWSTITVPHVTVWAMPAESS